ncbi:hypothetical protein BJ912DRAFT_963853 [Pholiota molesta]|nr:hypothetical protein BJ912DRAFT_963853 [Pholiota molesta]
MKQVLAALNVLVADSVYFTLCKLNEAMLTYHNSGKPTHNHYISSIPPPNHRRIASFKVQACSKHPRCPGYYTNHSVDDISCILDEAIFARLSIVRLNAKLGMLIWCNF